MDEPALPHSVPDPAPWLPGIAVPFWVWVIVVLVAVALAAGGWLLLTRRKPTAPGDLNAIYEASCGKLKSLRDDLAGRPLAEVATAASLALREYLAAALEEPALYETHEELISRHDAFEKLPAGSRERLAPLLDRLAASKYARPVHDDRAATELVENSLQVLDGLESTRPRAIA